MSEHQPHYAGHRQRLRQRFLKSGGDALADYEMLELVLFGAHPRGDVKPLAKALLARFGGFAEVICADPQALGEVKGMGDSAIAALKAIQAAAVRLGRDQVMNRSVLGSWRQLMEYCRTSLAYEKTEQFRILFLNRRNELIADEMQQKGTIDHTPVYPREVVKRALELGASALILVHNHPSGDLEPSSADIEMTRRIGEAGASLNIRLHDHVVVGRGGYYSFKAHRLL